MSLVNTLKILINHPINRKNKLAAVGRFLRWQFASRFIQMDVVYKWIENSKFIARTGETGVTGNIYWGLHEFSDMAFLLHVLREDDVFADVGANVGTYTILASSVVGARSYCFEPVPSTFERLLANIRINGMEDKVFSMNLALGNSKGVLQFSSDQNCTNHVVAKNESLLNVISVDVSTLDEEMQDPPFLMKIDVEGYETPALDGAKLILENHKLCAVIIELNGSGNRYGYEEAKIITKMSNYGFKTYSYDPIQRVLVDLEGKSLPEGNTIFIRNIDLVKERINLASKVKVHGVSI